MSIQRKLMLTISLLMFVTLLLNVVFSHINTKKVHQENLSQQIDSVANQLAITLKLIEDTNRTLENEMARNLQSTAKAAEQLLPADHNDISNEMLIALAKKLNIQGLTLWVMDENKELVSIKSSKPEEILLRSKTWDYFDVAMKEVYNMKPISVIKGEAFNNFYSGPLNFSFSDPTKISKFGYYYSGKTNYLINTIVTTEQIYKLGYLEQQQKIVNDILMHVEGLVEITAFNPTYFGKEKIVKITNGKPVQNLDVRDIIYGNYSFTNGQLDVDAVKEAVNSAKPMKVDFEYDGAEYSRMFVPIMAQSPYVISFVFNKDIMLQDTYEQLADHVIISVFLFIIAILVTNYLSSHFVAPILKIKEKVMQIARQNFEYPLEINSKDELGLLATDVNKMNEHLMRYTTELQQTANQLQRTEHQLWSIISLTNDPIVLLNLDLKIYHVNDAFIELFGYKWNEAIDKQLSSLSPHQEDEVNRKISSIITNGFIEPCELELMTIHGEIKEISLSLSQIVDMNDNCIGLAGIIHDMTSHHEKKHLLLQNEKLATISQISATIAHEFRNPLTTLQGFLKLSQQRGQLSAEYIPTLLNELEHMELILGQFLTMAKPQAYKKNKLDIVHLLQDITQLLRFSGKLDNIELIWQTEEPSAYVEGDNKYMRQAFVNIIKNSIEAMPNGGTITLTVHETHDLVNIIITDTGVGISSEHLNKIFDPFFTNKEFGTGLGLLVTQHIIVDHQGQISYSSELNKGTTVTIEFPKMNLL